VSPPEFATPATGRRADRRPARRPGPPRILRALQIQLDHMRIWSKVTWNRGRVLSTRDTSWEAHDDPAWFAEPRRFYSGRATMPDVVESPIGRIAGAEVVRFSFPTLRPNEYPETNLAIGRLYRSTLDPDAPVVVISHGWAHRTLKTIEHLYVRPFVRAGFSVAFVSHPFHLERTPRGSYSGELVVSADVVLTVEAFRQGVVDLIGTADWLRSRGARRVGVMGYSLGGYLAGIMAAVRGDWSFVVMGGAGDTPVSPILDTPLGKNIREDLAACGMLDRTKLTRAWKIISPGAFRPRVAKRRILMVAGRYDRIMLPRSVRRLWNAWDRPELHWLARSHYTLLATNGGLLAHAIPFMRRACDE
jgi:acetyl esterase/lipase